MSKDTKTSKTTRRRRTMKNSPSANLPTNTMIFSSSWVEGPLSANTAGTIATTSNGSIQNCAEYASLATIFTEVRLLSYHIRLSSKALTSNTGTAVLQGRIWVGTDMAANANVGSTPTTYNDVTGLPGRRVVPTSAVFPIKVRMIVPKNLEFSPINGDAPNPATPYAGSPGALYYFGQSLTASQEYFDADHFAVWELRGRI